MGRGLKIAGGVFAALAILAVAILYLGSSIDSIVESGIEKYGSRILKASVRVDSVEISPQNGKGTLRGVFIGNPEGFETQSAFELGEVTLALDLGSLTGNPVVIKEIRVVAPRLTYELNENGSNLEALQKNVAAYTGSDSSKGSAPAQNSAPAQSSAPAQNSPDAQAERKLVIEKLSIQKGTINVSASSLVDGVAEVPLPALEFKNIGKEKGGTSPDEVAAKLLDAVTQQVVAATAGLGLDAVRGMAEEKLKGIGGILDEGADDIGSAIESIFGN